MVLLVLVVHEQAAVGKWFDLAAAAAVGLRNFGNSGSSQFVEQSVDWVVADSMRLELENSLAAASFEAASSAAVLVQIAHHRALDSLDHFLDIDLLLSSFPMLAVDRLYRI